MLPQKTFFKIVIPNYNNGEYLKKCLDSLLNQTFSDYVIILVDDMSTDGSYETAKKYESLHSDKMVCKRLEEKGFAGGARNVGIDYPIESEYTWFIDGDDCLLNDEVFELLHNNLVETKPDMFFFGHIMQYHGGSKVKLGKKFNIKDDTFGYTFDGRGGPLRITKSEIVQKFVEKCCFGEDIYQFFSTLRYAKTFDYIPDPIYYIVYNKTSTTKDTKKGGKGEKRSEHKKLFDKNLYSLFLKTHDTNLKNAIWKRLEFDKFDFSSAPKSKICIITAATDNLAYQYNVTNNIKQKYCNLHGYDYKFINLNMEKKKAFHARKDLLVEYMDEYEWVMWMDTDAWFNNFDISLESIIKKYANKNTDLIIARDHGVLGAPSKYHDCFVNSGILLFRSCEDSKKMISLWKNPPEYAKEWMLTATKLNDQPFLSIRILWDSYFSERTKVVPAEEFNYFAHLKGDQTNVFILHAPGKKDENWYVKKFERMVEPTLERLKHYDFKKKEQKKVVEEVPVVETKIEKKQPTTRIEDVKKTNINMGSKKDLTLMDIVADTSEKVKSDGAISLEVSKSNKNGLKYKKMEKGWKP